jgi:asparagine synthase (glutamine-hydrolysing)
MGGQPVGGIAGILNSDGMGVEPALLEGMLRAIAHRGTNGAGVCYDGSAALGEVRSAACPPIARTAPLPADRGLSIAFDGAIYNDCDLRDDLRRRGHQFTTGSDAELALRAFEEFGEDCVRHFNGAWALAIWDGRNRRLFASRDPLGIRPFYYTTIGRAFLFASEIKALCQHPQLARDIDVIALDQIFTLHAALPPRTILRGVYELPPGFSLFWSDGALQVFRHAQLDFRPDEAQDDALVQERLNELLTDAVRVRLRDSRHVATQASGSFDDLLTAALVARCSESVPAPLELDFDDRAAVQRPLARSAALPGEGPSLLRCSPTDIGHIFSDVVRHAETPFLETSPAVMFLWARFACEQGYRAVVSGAGADELFGGCDIYKEARLRRFWSRQPDSTGRRQLLERFFSESAAPGARTWRGLAGERRRARRLARGGLRGAAHGRDHRSGADRPRA